MSSHDHLKGIPMSDAWLEKSSDDSDSADRSLEFIKRPKAKHDWSVPRGHRKSDLPFEDQDDSDVGESDDLDDDDADDEDWTAYDHDRKRRTVRPVRPGPKPHGIAIHRQSNQRDRSRAKLGSNLLSRSASQAQITGQSTRTARHPPGRPKLHQGIVNGNVTRKQAHNTSRRANAITPRAVQLPDELTRPRQCFGPGCTRAAARPDTKYCSDECGIKLALRRIEILLPESLAAMNCPSKVGKTKQEDTNAEIELERPNFVAEQLDRARLDEIQVEKCAVRDRLIQLETEHQQLDALVARAREHATPSSSQVTLAEVAKDAEQIEQMEPVVCVTCASEVSMRHALRHMEKCFQKMEGNTVFCANQKEQIMGTPLFCDAYDTQAKAYCKRLKVVCEHFKEPKLPPDTVCGFPFVHDVFVETGDFCCVPRSRCNRHLGWERLRRAQIDLERYRHFIRMDELLQEEQRVQHSIAQRGGLLGMLLHRTVDHNPSVPVPIPAGLKIKTAED
ncbi:CpG-binding protein [Fasciola hepatica]|uniref:CXXC-type zinc finger protein 1 n=1 Tax=Fasciola hepatica TaxID=6192 RepID=A0A4E0S0C1_FASHE|nr:CpG-binding protein [Fasciola hepatica]